MIYFYQVLIFLNSYSVIILPSLFALVLLFGVVNWASNVYRKQNKQIALTTRCVSSFPHKTALYVNCLPEDYRRQWRAYVNSGASKPSMVFEFVKKKQKTHLIWLFVLTALASSLFIVAFAYDVTRVSYIVFQVALWLAFGLTIVANRAVNKRNEKQAKQLFGRLVSQLNRNTEGEQGNTLVENTVKQLQQLTKKGVDDATLGKASEILNKQGLNTQRTVDEQRKLNTALNSLLQAYAKNAKNNPI